MKWILSRQEIQFNYLQKFPFLCHLFHSEIMNDIIIMPYASEVAAVVSLGVFGAVEKLKAHPGLFQKTFSNSSSHLFFSSFAFLPFFLLPHKTVGS